MSASSSSRVLSEVGLLKDRLEKQLLGSGAAVSNNPDAFDETIYDALQALERLDVDLDVLKRTMIGQTVNNIRKKCGEARIQGLAKELYQRWKKAYETAQSTAAPKKTAPEPATTGTGAVKSPKAETVTASKEAAKADAPAAPVVTGSSAGSDPGAHFASLPAGRKNVGSMLLRYLQEERDVEECADPVAIARSIEAAINERFPFGAADKQYEANARKLVFSMKQNQQLRVSLLLGETRPESVVLMSKDELATCEQLQERQRALAADMMSRDLDWVKKNRDAVFLANGLDPSAGGEFTCKRCKGTKTHHYSMQTRSSDEPMTVFVTCLTCNNRWRS